MIKARTKKFWGIALLGPAALVALAAAAPSDPSAANEDDSSVRQSTIDHGKYLVHHVAQCIECHTPRDERGNLLPSRLLTGASIPVRGPAYAQPWAAESASLAGLGGYENAFIHYLLTHGRKPDGSKPKSPMPSFRMTGADADAVIAYLRSL